MLRVFAKDPAIGAMGLIGAKQLSTTGVLAKSAFVRGRLLYADDTVLAVSDSASISTYDISGYTRTSNINEEYINRSLFYQGPYDELLITMTRAGKFLLYRHPSDDKKAYEKTEEYRLNDYTDGKTISCNAFSKDGLCGFSAKARYKRLVTIVCHLSIITFCVRFERANIITPEVSLSKRCTAAGQNEACTKPRFRRMCSKMSRAVFCPDGPPYERDPFPVGTDKSPALLFTTAI